MSSSKKTSSNLDLYKLDGVLLKSLWVVEHLTTSKNDRFSTTEIARYLVEEMGINCSKQAVNQSLIRHPKLTNRNSKGFKIMRLGKNKLKEEASSEEVIFIESGKPFSGKHLTAKKVLSKLKGTICICDPYIDLATLDVIFNNIDKNNRILILTSNVSDKPKGVFSRTLSDLKHEGSNIEVRIYNKSVLHDRYFIDDQSFWFSGNSLNHLGKKESFVARLGEDIRQSMKATFNRRWKISNPI